MSHKLSQMFVNILTTNQLSCKMNDLNVLQMFRFYSDNSYKMRSSLWQ